MSDVTVDKKLQLVQQVRSAHHQNQSDLQKRERILYGQASQPKYASETLETAQMDAYAGTDELRMPVSTFKIRLLIALFLLFGILVWDITGRVIFGFTADQVFSHLKEDYSQKALEWISGIGSNLTP
ncbi:MAG: hypothetical protein LBM69_01465 [Lachnospiraceae bacterium]|jgi:hypothetical protein|nr:hypothetical protein [Lachnospiraceae bacterium]